MSRGDKKNSAPLFGFISLSFLLPEAKEEAGKG